MTFHSECTLPNPTVILHFFFSWDTNQESLLAYFSRYGDVIDCVVMKNSSTNRSRGFGFVTFADPLNIEAVLANCPHSLDGRTIDPKACNPRSMQKPKKSNGYPKVRSLHYNTVKKHAFRSWVSSITV